MTYREKYENILKDLIEKGGALSQVMKAVNEYNLLGNTGAHLTPMYREWSTKIASTCTECETEFVCKEPPDIDQEVCCNTCLKTLFEVAT